MITLLKKNERPEWVVYPSQYLDLVRADNEEFLPWYLMDKDQLLIRYEGLKKRYPSRSLFPFARNDNNDDVVCWEKEKPGQVVLIHDFASPGYEERMCFLSFLDWHSFVTNL